MLYLWYHFEEVITYAEDSIHLKLINKIKAADVVIYMPVK